MEVEFLTVEEVLALHATQLTRHRRESASNNHQ